MKVSILIITVFGLLFAGPIEDLKPGEWLAVPNSHLRSAAPDYSGTNLTGGLTAVINAWCGGAYDPNHNRMIIWGGGHNDYGGNEVYAFDVPQLKWIRLTDPYPNPNRCHETNADGSPVARHTYGGLAYINHADRFFALGGAIDCSSGGCGSHLTWTFNGSSGTWQNMEPSGPPPGGNCMVKCAYWPEDGRVYYAGLRTQVGGSGWFAYDYDNNTWTQLNGEEAQYFRGLTVDTKRKQLVSVGRYVQGTMPPGDVSVLDLTSPTLPRTYIHTTGDTMPVGVENPGLAYDPVADKVIGWYYGPEVYSLDLDTRVWTKHTPPPSNTVKFPNQKINSGGMYGRFAYMPDYDAFIAVIHVDSPVYIYKRPADLTPREANPAKNAGLMLDIKPNPFRHHTRIGLKGLQPGNIELAVYDVCGKRVYRANQLPLTFKSGELASGIYTVSVKSGRNIRLKRITLLK